jgi:hypothetical protein
MWPLYTYRVGRYYSIRNHLQLKFYTNSKIQLILLKNRFGWFGKLARPILPNEPQRPFLVINRYDHCI